MGDIIHNFENLIMLEELYRLKTGITLESVKHLEEYVTLILDHFAKTVNRTTGMGMDFVKFHLPVHLTDDIQRLGLPENSSSGPTESGHKENAKRPGERTQLRSEKIDYQTASRCHERIGIARVYFKHIETPGPTPTPKSPFLGFSHVATKDGIFVRNRRNGKMRRNDKLNWPSEEMTSRIKKILKEKILPRILSPNSAEMHLFTQYKPGTGEIYHANPAYGTDEKPKPWQDWAYVDFGNGRLIPCFLRLFVRIEKLSSPIRIPGNEISIDRDGEYAICDRLSHAIDWDDPDSEYKAHVDSHLVCKGKCLGALNSDGRRRGKSAPLYLIPLNKISKPCIAVPNIEAKGRRNPKVTVSKDEFRFLRTRSDWVRKLFHLAEEKFHSEPGDREPGDDPKDDDGSDDDDSDDDDSDDDSSV
jgi:hypothetical protein